MSNVTLIRALRQAQGMSAKEFMERWATMGGKLPQSTFYAVEGGTFAIDSPLQQRWGEVLGVKFDYLFNAGGFAVVAGQTLTQEEIARKNEKIAQAKEPVDPEARAKVVSVLRAIGKAAETPATKEAYKAAVANVAVTLKEKADALRAFNKQQQAESVSV